MNKYEDNLINKISPRVSTVKARTYPPIEQAIEATVKTIAAEADIMARKKMVAQMYHLFKTDVIMKILFRLDELGITLPSISE